LLIHGPSPGAWNMAVDEALLDAAGEERIVTLRFYEWIEPTLSLGYFQPVSERKQHPPSLECPFVRRSSGGGAILHDRELTYSFAMPVERHSAADVTRLSFSLHEALAAALAELGVASRLCQGAGPRCEFQPFLCFQRRAVGDLLVADGKVGGSAQRRRQGAILQHGSVLLASSAFAPELPGLVELTGRAISAGLLAEVFREAVGDRFKLKWTSPGETAPIDPRVETLLADKFASATWNLRR
jgi:lipoate-protein ligase A